jgi:hypothetical protein
MPMIQSKANLDEEYTCVSFAGIQRRFLVHGHRRGISTSQSKVRNDKY